MMGGQYGAKRTRRWEMSTGLELMMMMMMMASTRVRVEAVEGGTWELLVENAGIASMHTAITHYGHAVMLDRLNEGPSQLNLSAAECLSVSTQTTDCTAHSIIFIPDVRAIRPLTIHTDTWCSSGQFASNGTLIQTGGEGNGTTKVRYFTPCPPGGQCDWVEAVDTTLEAGRWYATNQLLPDGRMIVVGGLNQPNLEFIPSNGEGIVAFPFLTQNRDENGDNLYPYVHLLPDGNLFVFANQASVLYNYTSNVVVRTYPAIPGEPRSYPSAGSSVLLPVVNEDNFAVADILVCGGAQFAAFRNASGRFPASTTCGRIRATDANASWVMEIMPVRRCMGDMVLLPTRSVLIINGAQAGAQGYLNAFDPALTPVLYQPASPLGLRFSQLTPTAIPRMYHSTANLLPDGRILIAGSNPHSEYTFLVGDPIEDGNFPTELRVEAFSPPYLDADLAILRANFVSVPTNIVYGQAFTVVVQMRIPVVGTIALSLVNAPYVTHSFAQGQRLIGLGATVPIEIGINQYQIVSIAPPSAAVAPPSYYMLFAVNQGVPSVGAWVQLSS